MSMPSTTVDVVIDGRRTRARTGTTVMVALLESGYAEVRRSVGGEPRGPVCGMGICHECRVTIDGLAHRRACMVVVEQGMVVGTTGRGVVDG